jgi:hypothetical protein
MRVVRKWNTILKVKVKKKIEHSINYVSFW